MSYLSMYTIHQDGTAKEHQTFRNAFRGAMLIWTWLSQKYLPGTSPFMMMATEEGMQKLWDLAVSDKVKDAHRIVHANTFDRVAIKRENFPRLIEAMKVFSKDCSDPGHIPGQIEALEALQGSEDVVAVGWCQTSVCQPHWGTRHDDDDNEIPFNLANSDDHWFLFDEGELEMISDTKPITMWQDIQKILKKQGPLKIKELRFFLLKKHGLKTKKWEQQAIDADWSPPSNHPLEKTDPKFLNIVHEQLSRSNLILTTDWKLRLRPLK